MTDVEVLLTTLITVIGMTIYAQFQPDPYPTLLTAVSVFAGMLLVTLGHGIHFLFVRTMERGAPANDLPE